MAAACAAYAAVLFFLTNGYAIDDTWIHLQFARNLASGAGFRFMPSHAPVYAVSSPAWTLLLTAPYLGGFGGIGAARALSSLFAGLAVWLLHEILRRRGAGTGSAIAGAAVLAANPWMIRWGSSGMESSAAAAVTTAVMLALCRRDDRGLAAGLLSGLAFLIRPELAVAGPLCGIALAALPGPGRLRRALTALIAWGGIVAAWEMAAWLVFGTLVPSAAVAKASAEGFAGYLSGALPEMGRSLAASDAIMLACLLPALLMKPAGGSRKDGFRAFPLMLIAGLPLLLLAGKAPIVSRYLLPMSPCIAALVVPSMASTGGGIRQALARALLACAIALPLSAGILFVFPHMKTASANLALYRDIASYLRDSLPGGSVVAVQEIGIFEYYGGVELLDLGGLVSPEVDEASFPGIDRDASGSLAFLRGRGVTHYLDPHGLLAPLIPARDRTGVGLVPLKEWTFGGGTSLSGSGTYTRVLYRLEWL
jgi:hypothetical protein